MEIAMSNRVIARNGLGQFIRECEQAAEATVHQLVDDGAELSRAMAPEGSKPDPRTVPLKASITSKMTSRTSGHWQASARHALAIEFGAVPHRIEGSPFLSFFWDRMGENVVFRVVNHPGNGAQPYLRPAYEVIAGRAMQVAAEKYPG
jgi:hypothetical protein